MLTRVRRRQKPRDIKDTLYTRSSLQSFPAKGKDRKSYSVENSLRKTQTKNTKKKGTRRDTTRVTTQDCSPGFRNLQI